MPAPARQLKSVLGKGALRLLLLCAALYLLACVGCGTFQRRLIYFPPHFTTDQMERFAAANHLERWRSPTGAPIGWQRPSPTQPAAGEVLVMHGNACCAFQCAHYADAIQAAGALDVFLVEYPGYADRPGAPSERTLDAAASEAMLLLSTNKPIYLVGESLGTGVAAYLAGRYPDRVAGVASLAPYNRLADVGQAHIPILPVHWLLVDRYSAEDDLRDYRGPVAALVAGRDTVVPERFGRRLYDAYAGPKRLWEFPQGNHGTIMFQPPEVWKQVIAFWLANGRIADRP